MCRKPMPILRKPGNCVEHFAANAGLHRWRVTSLPQREGSFITVVSGLPRSGTSLMMQMLEAGGHPLLTDQVRGPDESNPRGYLEFEP